MYRQYTIVPCFYTYVRMYFDRRLHEAATLFTDQIVMMFGTFIMYSCKRWH